MKEILTAIYPLDIHTYLQVPFTHTHISLKIKIV